MSNYENKVKHLIGSECPECSAGTLKKKYNRRVKPAKPFLGCTNYPKCYYSLEIDGTKPEEHIDFDFDDHPHTPEALGQW